MFDILERTGLDLFPELPHDQKDRFKVSRSQTSSAVPSQTRLITLVSTCGPSWCTRAGARQRVALSGPTGGGGTQDDHHHLLTIVVGHR